MVDILVNHFGPDELGCGRFDRNEMVDNEWQGREWRAGEMGVIFRLNKGMLLYFFKAASADKQAVEPTTE